MRFNRLTRLMIKYYVFMWNHGFRDYASKHLIVQCKKCGAAIKGKNDIETWLASWNLCSEHAIEKVKSLWDAGNIGALLAT